MNGNYSIMPYGEESPPDCTSIRALKKKYVPKIPYMGIQLLAYDVWLRHLYSRQKELFKIRQTKSRYFGGIFKDHSWFQKRLKRPVKMILNIIGNQL